MNLHASLFPLLEASCLRDWIPELQTELAQRCSDNVHGDYSRWLEILDQLPACRASTNDFRSSHVTVGRPGDLEEDEIKELHALLMGLSPWRKGPFSLFGLEIDTEWRSDWKWERVLPHISPLQGRTILDVGCGSGYHLFRMLGENAKLAIGIDPMLKFMLQFYAIRHFAGDVPAHVLPYRLEELPGSIESCFDTVFSMGVLYHRRSPIDHLAELKTFLKKDGELVLETLVIEGGEGSVLVPEGRYAKMRNVWFIPSTELLARWLQRCGYVDIRVVDVSPTTVDEQRATAWMTGESLVDFLDPQDHSRTIEGYQAPLRAVIVAHKS